MEKQPLNQEMLILNDVELLDSYRLGNEQAVAFIFARYALMINHMISSYYVAGVEEDDLRQEALVGLFNAIRTFQKDRNVSFYTYANHCIANKLKNYLVASNTNKAQILNQFVSLEDVENVPHTKKGFQNPENIFIQKESCQSIITQMQSVLSPFEQNVIHLYLCGYDYRLIALKLHSSRKTIDNALQRARRKLKAVFAYL